MREARCGGFGRLRDVTSESHGRTPSAPKCATHVFACAYSYGWDCAVCLKLSGEQAYNNLISSTAHQEKSPTGQ